MFSLPSFWRRGGDDDDAPWPFQIVDGGVSIIGGLLLLLHTCILYSIMKSEEQNAVARELGQPSQSRGPSDKSLDHSEWTNYPFLRSEFFLLFI